MRLYWFIVWLWQELRIVRLKGRIEEHENMALELECACDSFEPRPCAHRKQLDRELAALTPTQTSAQQERK